MATESRWQSESPSRTNLNPGACTCYPGLSQRVGVRVERPQWLRGPSWFAAPGGPLGVYRTPAGCGGLRSHALSGGAAGLAWVARGVEGVTEGGNSGS